ncbi:MAG: hypothetical protein ACPG8W_15715 [Candidatus Promineifilaceae bacterium]
MSADVSTTAQLVRQLLAANGKALLTVESDSMEPLLLVNERIQIETITVAQLELGDIVTVVASDALYTHRYFGCLTKHDARFLVTRGDQPLAYDPAWSEKQLLGRVTLCKKRETALDLRQGVGRRLNQHLTAIAGFENWLYDGRSPTLKRLEQFETRLLGRNWRDNAIQHLLLRAIRGFLLRWSRVMVFLAVKIANNE